MAVFLEMGVPLVLALGLIVSLGFLLLYRASLKPILLGIASLFYFSLHGPFFNLGKPLAAIGDAITAAADAIDHAIASAVLACEGGIVFFWHQLAKQARWLGNLLGDMMETIETQWRWLLAALPPFAALWEAVTVARKLPALLRSLRQTVTYPTKIVRTSVRVLDTKATAAIGRLETEVAALRRAVAAAAAQAPAIPFPRIGNPSDDLAAIRAKVRGLSKWLTAANAAAIVAAALGRLGLGWTRCQNTRRLGKNVCGMDPSLVDSLIADTLLVLGTVSLIEFAEGMQGLMGETASTIGSFWRA